MKLKLPNSVTDVTERDGQTDRERALMVCSTGQETYTLTGMMLVVEKRRVVGSWVVDWKGDARIGLKEEEGREKGEVETEEQEKRL